MTRDTSVWNASDQAAHDILCGCNYGHGQNHCDDTGPDLMDVRRAARAAVAAAELEPAPFPKPVSIAPAITLLVIALAALAVAIVVHFA